MMKRNLKTQSPNLRKVLLSLLILLTISITVFSQSVGISAAYVPADPAAGLDVNFTSQGLLIPRDSLKSTTSFLPLSAHVAGMVIYNTATAADVTPGFYFNDGSKWIAITLKANAAGDIQYWDGTGWVIIPVGLQGQALRINSSGIPAWSTADSPTLTTIQLTSITAVSAMGGGIILKDGGTAITTRGVVWSTTTGPTVALTTKTIDGSGVGTFTSSISSITTPLITGNLYFIRSYATTINGTTYYGNELSFTTL